MGDPKRPALRKFRCGQGLGSRPLGRGEGRAQKGAGRGPRTCRELAWTKGLVSSHSALIRGDSPETPALPRKAARGGGMARGPSSRPRALLREGLTCDVLTPGVVQVRGQHVPHGEKEPRGDTAAARRCPRCSSGRRWRHGPGPPCRGPRCARATAPAASVPLAASSGAPARRPAAPPGPAPGAEPRPSPVRAGWGLGTRGPPARRRQRKDRRKGDRGETERCTGPKRRKGWGWWGNLKEWGCPRVLQPACHPLPLLHRKSCLEPRRSWGTGRAPRPRYGNSALAPPCSCPQLPAPGSPALSPAAAASSQEVPWP